MGKSAAWAVKQDIASKAEVEMVFMKPFSSAIPYPVAAALESLARMLVADNTSHGNSEKYTVQRGTELGTAEL